MVELHRWIILVRSVDDIIFLKRMVDGVLNLAPMVRARGLHPWERSIKRLPARFLRVVSPTRFIRRGSRP